MANPWDDIVLPNHYNFVHEEEWIELDGADEEDLQIIINRINEIKEMPRYVANSVSVSIVVGDEGDFDTRLIYKLNASEDQIDKYKKRVWEYENAQKKSDWEYYVKLKAKFEVQPEQINHLL